MTDETTQTPPPIPSPADWIGTAWAILKFVKEYFVVISAIAILAGVAIATIFLYAYLQVFDWHLFWLVQYPDILTFALVAIGIGGGLATFFGSLFEGILIHTGIPDGKPNWAYILVLALVYALGLAFNIYAEHKSPDPQYLHIVFGWLSILSFVIVVVAVGRIIHLRAQTRGLLVVWTLLNLIFATYTSGRWLGYSVIESSGYEHDVYLKNSTLTHMTLVLMMSHHTILYKDKVLYVVPTSDIEKIISTPQK